VYFYTVFLLVSHGYFYYGHLRFGHFKRNQHNIERWRELAVKLVDTIFFITCVRIHVEGREHVPDGPVVFAANHQSYLDGLIIVHVVRRPFTAVTGPFHMFPHIIHEWFEHMGYMSVARDVFEELRYKGTVRLGRAVDHCIGILKKNTSILIFPEGRREFKKHLLPFHLGVARMALEAHAPVIPIILEHVDAFLPATSHLLTPTHISVKISKPVRLWKVSKNELADTIYLEREIKKHMPKSYFTEHSVPHYVHGVRAAFFDLDDTLTRSNVYQKLVAQYLMRHLTAGNVGKIPRLVAKRILLKHGYFYLAAIRLLRGIRASEFLRGFYGYLKKHKNELFYPQMLELMSHHQEKGNCVFIISEEPQEVLDPIAKLLGVPCFGTIVEKKKGVFTGEVVGHIMKDEYKREKVIELAKKYTIDLEKSYAYGDSYHDYAILRSVGHAALVNPKKSFGAHCKRLGMRVIHEK
jgi:HAD superfamily hydrolase (TIGR01490 family)